MGRRLDGALPRLRPDAPVRWHWISAALALGLHAAFYLLLRGGPPPAPPVRGERVERIRLVFSERAPPPAAPRPAPAPQRARSPDRAGPAPARAASEPTPAAAAVLETSLPDRWSVPAEEGAAASRSGAGHFRRDLFARGEQLRPEPANHLPRLQMHDSSLAGRWHEQARRIDCGELAAAMRAGSETLVGGGHGPGARRPMGGGASSETLLQSMKRRGCGR